jgi:hypothetical protein
MGYFSRRKNKTNEEVMDSAKRWWIQHPGASIADLEAAINKVLEERQSKSRGNNRRGRDQRFARA